MPGEPERVVREAVDAWNRRDLDALIALSSEDIVYVNPPNALEPGTRRGHEQLREVARKQWEFLGDATQRIERLHERDDAIIIENVATRHMSDSGVPMQNRLLMAWTVRNGLIERIEVLGGGSDFDDARRDAGLG